MNGTFFEELMYKNTLFRNPKMFQTYSQNPNTGYYLRHNKLIQSSEVISTQFTAINKTQILHITASYEKNDLFSKQNGKKKLEVTVLLVGTLV